MRAGHTRAPRSLVATALALFAGGLLVTPASDAAPRVATELQLAPYLAPQGAVAIGKDRTINLVCLGRGSPTVVLTAGLEAWSVEWLGVQPPLAKRTRVCAWDRAGFGFSGPSPEPQDVVHTTDDLERALQRAGIGGPRW